MNLQPLALQPFSPDGSPSEVRLTGAIARRAKIVAMRYELWGPWQEFVPPLSGEPPARRHRLWEDTCFELFLAVKGEPEYWEFNLSPGGQWNVYRFDACRQGMEEERAFTALPLSVRRQPEVFRLELEVEAGKIVPPAQPLEVGLSAVLKGRDGKLTYWALTHPGSQPDFHRRDSFIANV
ncbi:MAG: DOMON-like domain-containing protein [Syntrophobacterales bacterium]|jgi:hypothetical protein|nr:DOMON-like domain-containing protein [Syntrophobacterales bacterium]